MSVRSFVEDVRHKRVEMKYIFGLRMRVYHATFYRQRNFLLVLKLLEETLKNHKK